MEELKQNIYEKLQASRVELQEMKLPKGGKNKFAGFEYYELADFIPAINKIFLNHKLHSIFNIEKSFNANNNQYEEIATLKIINIENPQEVEIYSSPTADANIKGCTPIQSLGGVHTYMKRYLYLNALEIVEPDLLDGTTGKDDDNKVPPKTQPKVPPKAQNTAQNTAINQVSNTGAITNSPMTSEQTILILGLDQKYKDFALKKYNIDVLEKLTSDQAQYIIDSLRAKGVIK